MCMLLRLCHESLNATSQIYGGWTNVVSERLDYHYLVLLAPLNGKTPAVSRITRLT
jgi:hypothetical protein